MILGLFFKKLKSEPVSWVVLAYCLLFFLLNFYFDQIPKEYRKLYYILFTAFEFLFFSSILFLQLSANRLRNVVIIFSGVFLVFQLIYSFSEKFKYLDSIPIGVESIIIFIFIFGLFYEQFKHTKTITIYVAPWFWFATGIMLYLAGSFFFNILVNNIDSKVGREYWYFTYIFETIKNIFFGIALIYLSRNKKSNNLLHSKSVPYLDMI